jgi:hypothetical protein
MSNPISMSPLQAAIQELSRYLAWKSPVEMGWSKKPKVMKKIVSQIIFETEDRERDDVVRSLAAWAQSLKQEPRAVEAAEQLTETLRSVYGHIPDMQSPTASGEFRVGAGRKRKAFRRSNRIRWSLTG